MVPVYFISHQKANIIHLTVKLFECREWKSSHQVAVLSVYIRVLFEGRELLRCAFSGYEKTDWIAPIGVFCIYSCDLYADMNEEYAVLDGNFKP